MIGQAGIGKTKFLQNIPNVTQIESDIQFKETFKFTCVNSCQSVKRKSKTIDSFTNGSQEDQSNFDQIEVEITNHDINMDSFINTNDLGDVNFTGSQKLVDANGFKIVILAFSMSELDTFELIKTKYETYLKNNQCRNSHFILLGLNSDDPAKESQLEKCEAEEIIQTFKELNILTTPSPVTKRNKSKIKKSNTFSYKKRSCSINSNSSTSNLHMNRKNSNTDLDTQETRLLRSKACKNFAKHIGAGSFIKSSKTDYKSPQTVNTYSLLTLSICSIFNNTQLTESNSKSLDKSKGADEPKAMLEKIPKSLSAPINYLIKRKKTEKNDVSENYNFNSNPDEPSDHAFTKLDDNAARQFDNNVSVKEKFSRLFLGFGTYIVTCGSSQSRKLVLANRLRSMKHSRTHNDLNSNLVDKSWLLLSSHTSLNSLNDAYEA